MKKNYVSFDEAKDLLQEGDILLFEGSSLFSWFIMRAGDGRYSHAAMVSKHGTNGGSFWECVEFKEWQGGRTINLERYLRNEKVDVYRCKPQNVIEFYDPESQSIQRDEKEFNGKVVTNKMRTLTGLPYGWTRIFWIAKNEVLRFIWSNPNTSNDNDDELIYPVCSTAVAHCFSHAGFDLVQNRSDQWTEPSDLSRSALLNYLFTIKNV